MSRWVDTPAQALRRAAVHVIDGQAICRDHRGKVTPPWRAVRNRARRLTAALLALAQDADHCH